MTAGRRRKVLTPEAAAALIVDGDTLAVGGFVGLSVPEELLIALAERFGETGGPRDLTLVFAAGQGDGGARGLNRLADEGLIRRAIGAHWGPVPALGALALDGRIEADCLPLGVVSHLYRETAAGRPGLITRVGLGTFVDPRIEGGRMNAVSTRSRSPKRRRTRSTRASRNVAVLRTPQTRPQSTHRTGAPAAKPNHEALGASARVRLTGRKAVSSNRRFRTARSSSPRAFYGGTQVRVAIS